MEAFTTLTARGVSMPENDVDTDIIFPARFLLITEKKGLGRYAFYERRFDAAGAERADFVFNQTANAGAAILVAGENFGCGSSREQAPWALDDLGIRCIVAPSFGEIFYGNCFKNGMLAIVLQGETLAAVRRDAEAGAALTVDLDARLIRRADGQDIAFAIEDWRRTALLNGWDEIETILARRTPDIAAFEARQRETQQWLWPAPDIQEHEHHG